MNESEFHFQRGVAHLDAGDFLEAAACFRHAGLLDPRRADVHTNLGLCQQHLGQPAEAEASFRRALELQPDSVAALNNLGLLLREQRRLVEAAEAFRRGLQLRPDHPVLHNNLGLIHADELRADDAVECYQRALQLQPAYAEAHNNLGLAMLNLDRFDDAEQSFRRAQQFAPEFADAWLHLGAIAGHRGDFPAAVENYRAALRRNANCAAAYYYLSLIRTAEWTDADTTAASSLADDVRLSDDDRAFASFALGNVFDRLAEYDRALEHFHAGNRRKSSRYDPNRHEEFVSQLIDVYSADFFSSRTVVGSDTSQPVFIVGMPRSGTTLVEQILAAHPAVHAAGEAAIFGELTRRPPLDGESRSYPQAVGVVDASAVRELANEYLHHIDPPADRLRFTDKTPANFLHLGLIAVLFPNARVVHCRRNPLDVCLSCYFRNFQTVEYSTRLEHLGHYHRQYECLMAHWRNVLPSPMHEVSYEELIDAPARVTRELVAACGLSWDEVCLDFPNTSRPVSTASDWQVRQPLYGTSVGRWRNYERHLAILKASLGIG